MAGGRPAKTVAGPGVTIESVDRSLFQPDYLLVSARPWRAGYISDAGVRLTSYGQVGFVMSGSFSDKRQIQMDVAHPQGRNCAMSMTVDFAGRSNTFANYFAEGNPRIFTFFISNSSGSAVFGNFGFIIY